MAHAKLRQKQVRYYVDRCRYTRAAAVLGYIAPARLDADGDATPESEEKCKMFKDVQDAGFKIAFRYKVCSSNEEACELEKALLQKFDYPANKMLNGNQRRSDWTFGPNGETVNYYLSGGR